ncbi:hypothetical protein [Nostoc sp.]|uniref:hypothetical protein n=1 Tax=Nostoc sp. TaxID=1180 RepID=UPI002FF2B927
MAHWALVLSERKSVSKSCRKACGIATLRAQPKVEKYWTLGSQRRGVSAALATLERRQLLRGGFPQEELPLWFPDLFA